MWESTINYNGAQRTIQSLIEEEDAITRTHERLIKCFIIHSGRTYWKCQDCGWQSHQENKECNALIKSKESQNDPPKRDSILQRPDRTRRGWQTNVFNIFPL